MKRLITIVTRSIPAHGPGGMERATWMVATGLAETGWDVEVVTTALPSGVSFGEEGLSVYGIKNSKAGCYSENFFRGVKRHLEQGDAQAPVLAVSAAGFDYVAIPRTRRRSVTIVCHGTSFDEIRSKLKTRTPRALFGLVRQLLWFPRDVLAYRRADKIITVNDPITRQIRRLLPERHHSKVTTVYNGYRAPSKINQRCRFSDSDFVICTSGRLVREKGVHILLEACALLTSSERPNSVIICGSGPELESLRTRANELGLRETNFVGHVADVFPFIYRSTVLVLPSLRLEGLPLSIIEALSVGCPVLVPSNLPFPSVGQDGIHRFAVGDPHDLARALKEARAFTWHSGLVPALSFETMIAQYSNILGRTIIA